MLVRYLYILSWLSFYVSYYSLRIHVKHLDFLKERKNNKPIKKQLPKKRRKGRIFCLTASLAQAIRDDLHLIVRIFPSPSCKTVALFLNQPLSVKINCKEHSHNYRVSIDTYMRVITHTLHIPYTVSTNTTRSLYTFNA